MIGCSIAFIGSETVLGIAAVEGGEETVALELGEDGSGGDGAGERVTFDERVLGERRRDADGVDEEGVGRGRERVDSAEHGEAAGLEDVDASDFRDARIADGPGEGLSLDAGGEAGAFGGGDGFGVADALDGTVGREDDGGGGDGAKKTAPAGFIDAGRSRKSESPKAGLVFKGASQG